MSIKNALVNPKMLAWSRIRARMDLQVVADRVCKGDVEKLESWEKGERAITIAQCRELAACYKTPLAVFYLNKPPEGIRILPDFRTESGKKPTYSFELSTLIQNLTETQNWLNELRNHAPMVDFIGSMDAKVHSAEEVASSIRKTININYAAIESIRDSRVAFNDLRSRVEHSGIFVFKFPNVASSEARGVALPDKTSPVIFVNPQDSWTGQRFTLAHELAHLWINQGGISDLKSNSDTEVFCNQVASNLLITDEAFKKFWKASFSMKITDRIRILARRFHVSREVVARKSLDFGIITEGQYLKYRKEFRGDWEKTGKTDSGGSWYSTHVSRYGREFIGLVMSGCQSGDVTLSEASRILRAKVNNFPKLCEAAQVDSPLGGRKNLQPKNLNYLATTRRRIPNLNGIGFTSPKMARRLPEVQRATKIKRTVSIQYI